MNRILGRKAPERFPLDRKVAGLGLERDPAQIGELSYSGLATEATVATGFDSAEGHLRFVMNRGTIDMAHSRLDLFRDFQGADNIAAENGGGETVLAVVGDAHGVRFVLGANDGYNGTKRFFGVEPHFRRDAIHHACRHDHAQAVTPRHAFGALVYGVVD